MVLPIASPIRPAFCRVVSAARETLLLAAPFVKKPEAEEIVSLVDANAGSDQLRLFMLTDLNSDSVMAGALDIEALLLFHRSCSYPEVVTVPRLHAKVCVADDTQALVSSANLTPSGLDMNLEYGVVLTERSAVRQVSDDLRSYARLGSPVSPSILAQLADVAEELAAGFAAVQRSAARSARRRFNATLKQATTDFLRAQVGERSAGAVFAEAILYALRRGPLTTAEINPAVQRLLPDLCDDSIELVINGERFGKRWKHQVRNAQQSLKRQGQIEFDGTRWRRVLGS